MKWLITGLRQKKYPFIWIHYESPLLVFLGSLKWTVFIRVRTAAVRRVGSAIVRNNTVLGPADCGGSGRGPFQIAAIATKNSTCLIFHGGLKWTVFIRVRTTVHRVKTANIRDNTALWPADNGGVTRCYHGHWRSLHGERRCEREWTRSISHRHFHQDKLNMIFFFFWRFPAVFTDHRGWVTDDLRIEYGANTFPRGAWRNAESPWIAVQAGDV